MLPTQTALIRQSRIRLYIFLTGLPIIAASTIIANYKRVSADGEIDFLITVLNTEMAISVNEYLIGLISYAVTSALLAWHLGRRIAIKQINRREKNDKSHHDFLL
jgi:hypothetical protein